MPENANKQTDFYFSGEQPWKFIEDSYENFNSYLPLRIHVNLSYPRLLQISLINWFWRYVNSSRVRESRSLYIHIYIFFIVFS